MFTTNRCLDANVLAAGLHAFAPLPGGWRRSAKKRLPRPERRGVSRPAPRSRSMFRMNRCVDANVFGIGATRFRTAAGRLAPLR
jgi:hypothetical protein